MKTQLLGPTDLPVSRLCYGAMRITGSWDDALTAEQTERGIRALECAVETGYTFIDHADIYGSTNCETVHGLALKKHPEWRDRLVVATKCGIRWEDEPKPGDPHRYDFAAGYIRESCENSLRRLKLDRVDLYQLHRPDFLADPDEIAAAFTDLQKAGKVRYFGVSNFRPSLVAMVQSRLPFPLVSNQVEISPLRLETLTDGTLDQCIEKKMTPLAWGPVAGGRLAAALEPNGKLPEKAEDVAAVARLTPVLGEIAKAYGVTPLAIVMAWLMRHPSRIIPIVGSVRPEMIKAAARADSIELDRESWYRILLAARGQKLA
jgi:predicted oxidoreductase